MRVFFLAKGGGRICHQGKIQFDAEEIKVSSSLIQRPPDFLTISFPNVASTRYHVLGQSHEKQPGPPISPRYT